MLFYEIVSNLSKWYSYEDVDDHASRNGIHFTDDPRASCPSHSSGLQHSQVPSFALFLSQWNETNSWISRNLHLSGATHRKAKSKIGWKYIFYSILSTGSPLLPPCTASPSLSWLTSWRISLILIPNVCSIRCWSTFCLFSHSTKQYSKHSLQSLNNKNKKEQQSIYR